MDVTIPIAFLHFRVQIINALAVAGKSVCPNSNSSETDGDVWHENYEEQVDSIKADKRAALPLSHSSYVNCGIACVWHDASHAGKRNVTAEQTVQKYLPLYQYLETVVL